MKTSQILDSNTTFWSSASLQRQSFCKLITSRDLQECALQSNGDVCILIVFISDEETYAGLVQQDFSRGAGTQRALRINSWNNSLHNLPQHSPSSTVQTISVFYFLLLYVHSSLFITGWMKCLYIISVFVWFRWIYPGDKLVRLSVT